MKQKRHLLFKISFALSLLPCLITSVNIKANNIKICELFTTNNKLIPLAHQADESLNNLTKLFIRLDFNLENNFVGNMTYNEAMILASLRGYLGVTEDFDNKIIDLYNLLHSSQTQLEFKTKLELWLTQNNINATPTFLSNILTLIETQPNTYFSFDNGFLAHYTYIRASLKGELIILDPHDTFFHIPSMLDPAFTAKLNKLFKISLKYFSEINNLPFLDGLPKEEANSIYDEGMFQATSFIFNFLRNASHENWTYLNSNGKLILQGNAPFSGLYALALANFNPNAIVDNYTTLDFFSKMQYFFYKENMPCPMEELKSLPGFEEFLMIPDHQLAVNHLNEIMKIYYLDSNERFKEGFLVLRKATKEALLYTINNFAWHDLGMSEATQLSFKYFSFLEKFEKLISESPTLKEFFSYNNRLQLFEKSLNVMELYYNWLKSNQSKLQTVNGKVVRHYYNLNRNYIHDFDENLKHEDLEKFSSFIYNLSFFETSYNSLSPKFKKLLFHFYEQFIQKNITFKNAKMIITFFSLPLNLRNVVLNPFFATTNNNDIDQETFEAFLKMMKKNPDKLTFTNVYNFYISKHGKIDNTSISFSDWHELYGSAVFKEYLFNILND